VTTLDDHAGCAVCAAPLRHDQRYCIACGERRGPLPSAIATLIAAGLRAGDVFPEDGLGDDADADRDLLGWMPPPRTAALAVIVLLAFGVLVGSAVSPPAESAPSSPVLVALQQPAATTPATDTVDEAPAPATPVESAPAPAPVAAATPAQDNVSAPPALPDTPALPDVHHLFLIVLSGHGYDETFGPDSPAPYLGRELPARGELLANYYGVAQSELANGVALISGQGPTVQTAADCPQYGDVAPGTLDAGGLVSGDGCVYPARALTLADQMTAAGRTWRAYVQSLASAPADAGAPPSASAGDGASPEAPAARAPAGAPATCRHPAPGTADEDHAPAPGDAYVTWRNPFVYFHSLLDTPACEHGDVDLGRLADDLRSADTTPTLSYIVPDRCHDGSDEPCAPNEPAGLAATDAWLRTVVPQIERSPAYQDGGVIAITFDQAPQSGPHADSGSCCDAQPFPNLAAGAAPPGGTSTTPATTTTTVPPTTATVPTTTVPATTMTTTATVTATTPSAPPEPPGGGRVGLLLISSFVKPGSVDQTDTFNHFSLLRSIEDLFGLDHLGYAADQALPAFDKVVWNAR